jgi:protease-4
MNDSTQMASNQTTNTQGWEQRTLEQLLYATLKEQRTARRWKIFFKFVLLFYVILFAALFFSSGGQTTPVDSHTALIDIKGAILEDKAANADNIITSIKQAFDDHKTKGIILRINSPGGSPVQVANISEELHRMHKKHPKVKVIAVCTDMCASGGYWLAASADSIYANPASMVGSIGVVMEGFGFTEIMKKVGVDRRLFTAGQHKGLLDPFSPLKPEEAAFAHTMLNEVHQQFIHYVVSQRGKKLKLSNPDLFSGLVWTGEDALKLGLIDGFGSEEYVAREIIQESTIVDYTVAPNYLERLANRFGTSFSSAAMHELERVNIR